jgi:hypothetical protein
MRPTEARYLSAISGILLLATITACSPKPSSDVSQAPTAAVPTVTATPAASPAIAPKTTAPSAPKTAEPTPGAVALDEPVLRSEKLNAKSSDPLPQNDRAEAPANREPSRSSDTQDERVNFTRGESSAVLKGAVIRAESKTYILNAAKDQVMDLDISALEDNAVIQVISPAGQVIGSEIKTMNRTLPETGDYQIIVSGTRGNATYELNVAIK